MYQLGGTIKDALNAIQTGKLVLPAIQREFVWQPEQIEQLFDSIMQGYPFGTFLYWKVEKESSNKYQFYGFVLNYHELKSPHCPKLPVFNNTELTAVLDGQQRLTALNIGLNGLMAWRIPYKWKSNPDAYPVQFLYLDLLSESGENEESGEKYRFKFLTEAQAEPEENEDPDECWFRVRDILGMQTGGKMLKWLNERLPQHKTTPAYDCLDTLHRAVHSQNLISYYEEKSQDLDKVLNTFIRMNSGGTVLSYSDLLLSIAVAQWKSDARTEIHTLVDELNSQGEGFGFSKDLVLKAGLMLADIGNVGFKVENFNRPNMQRLEKQWPEIKRSLQVAVQLLANFGFSEMTLRADSALLPIAYYIHHRGFDPSCVTKVSHKADRDLVRKWLIRSLLKASGIWGSGLDTLLTALRETIAKHGDEGFPSAKLRTVMAQRGKSLQFSDEEVDELVDMSYGDKRVFSLLVLLFPFVDTKHHVHIGHVFPRSLFTPKRLAKAGVAEEDFEELKDLANRLPNLQLLDGPENIDKRDTLPLEWITTNYPSSSAQLHYAEKHLLGEVLDNLADFKSFYDARRLALRARIKDLLAIAPRK